MTKTWFLRVKNLHKLIIHKNEGSDKDYYQESRDIAKLSYSDSVLSVICSKCFGNNSKCKYFDKKYPWKTAFSSFKKDGVVG